MSEVTGVVDASSPHELIPYRGFGNGTRVLVHGRAVRCANIRPSTPTDGMWQNLVNTYKRIDSKPLAGARVEVRIGGVLRAITADGDGFFRAWIDLPAQPPPDEPWHRAFVALLAPLRVDQPDVRVTAVARVPEASSTFAVISDLDDTVIQSGITNLLPAARTVMLGNARTRLPFPGVAAFYQALERGGDGTRRNPIFYVSSSPWNIHDLIAEFMTLQRIPAGPICLRRWDIDLNVLAADRLRNHKEPIIREIMELYPTLSFILIGDSGQQDPEIYRAIIDRYPNRILAIYIRNVHSQPERLVSIQKLAQQVLAAGSSLILADDTYAAARHAAEHGWIAVDALPTVRVENEADTNETRTKAHAPSIHT